MACALGPVGATASAPVGLTVVPREDLVDGQIVEISIVNAPARESFSLDTCARLDERLSCSESGRSVRVQPSGDFGPVAEKVRSILITRAGRFDCRDASTSCVLALRAGDDVLATAPLSFRPAAPLESAPTLTLDRGEALDDGQTVQVRGSGFDISVHTGVRQCRAGALDSSACRPAGRPPITSDTGTLQQDIMVYAGFGTVNDEWVDCSAPGSCELVVFSGRGDDAPVRTPITFAGPPVVAPTITVSPSELLTDGQVLTVQGNGFVADATLSIEQYVVQDGDAQSRWRLLITNGFVSASPRGSFSTQIMVRTTTENGAPVCHDPRSPCLLVAREAHGRYGVAKTALSFRP